MRKDEGEVTVRQARDLGDMTYHHFAQRAPAVRPWLPYIFYLFACLLYFVPYHLPEVRWQGNGTVNWPIFFQDNGKIWSHLSLKKSVNSNFPGWLSITSKINPRETSCGWDIDCSLSSGPESICGASAPSLQGKRMKQRSGVACSLIFFFRIPVSRTGLYT